MKRPVQGRINRSLMHIHTVLLINWLTIASAAAGMEGGGGGAGGTNTVPRFSQSHAGGHTELGNTGRRLQSINKPTENDNLAERRKLFAICNADVCSQMQI